jgi:hypothetical protein
MTTTCNEAIAERYAVVVATGVAILALMKQFLDARTRRKAINGRISAQAYMARRTINSWLKDPSRPPPGPSDEEAKFVKGISEHFPDVERRFELIAADAPEASRSVGRSVRKAFVLFNQATARAHREMYRGEKLGKRDDREFTEALGDFQQCVAPLTQAIDRELRDK